MNNHRNNESKLSKGLSQKKYYNIKKILKNIWVGHLMLDTFHKFIKSTIPNKRQMKLSSRQAMTWLQFYYHWNCVHLVYDRISLSNHFLYTKQKLQLGLCAFLFSLLLLLVISHFLVFSNKSPEVFVHSAFAELFTSEYIIHSGTLVYLCVYNADGIDFSSRLVPEHGSV